MATNVSGKHAGSIFRIKIRRVRTLLGRLLLQSMFLFTAPIGPDQVLLSPSHGF
jgi:hypothetical protein